MQLPLAHALELDEIHTLSHTGATELAIRLMDQVQPDFLEDMDTWTRWEEERIIIYKQSNDWQSLADRLAQLPPGLSVPFIRLARTQRAEALLALGDGTQARQVLMNLIWSSTSNDKDTRGWIKQWRRLVIESYLADKLLVDARTASQRYQQDYSTGKLADHLLQARVLLLSGRPQDAVRLLEKHVKAPQAGMLYLLAQLRSGARSPRKVMQAALRQMQGKWVKDELKFQLWAVVAEAAKRAGDRGLAVNALEHVLAEPGQALQQGLFEVNADSLWDAYLDYALYIGNKAQYLIGQDDKWFAAASKAQKKTPVKARSLYALLIQRGQDQLNRNKAAGLFVDLMRKRKHGAGLLRKLFIDSRYFASLADIPLSVRYALAEFSLRTADIEGASRLMATIDAPPNGVDEYRWSLRRARILVLGGNPEQGAEVLREVLVKHKKLSGEQIDHLLQIVFDLQTVGADDVAYDLFVVIRSINKDPKQERELLYWMADSRKAQQRHLEAARLYLKSAMMPDPAVMDPWAQTARYKAAEALAAAGLINDARNLYQQLLKATKDTGRRAVLRRELQKLWLLQQRH